MYIHIQYRLCRELAWDTWPVHMHTHTQVVVSSVAGITDTRALWVTVPNPRFWHLDLHAHRCESPSPRTIARSGAEWEDRTACSNRAQGMDRDVSWAATCLHTISHFYLLSISISLSPSPPPCLFLPIHLDPSLSLPGPPSKDPVVNLAQSPNAPLLHPRLSHTPLKAVTPLRLQGNLDSLSCRTSSQRVSHQDSGLSILQWWAWK